MPYTRETKGFGLYTYVLVKSIPTSKDDIQRLHNLVRGALAQGSVEDLGHPATEATGPQAPPARPLRTDHVADMKNLSVIYIPVLAPYPGDSRDVDAMATWIVDQHHYDVTVAEELLLNLACQTNPAARENCSSQFREAGPYLVSTVIALSVNHPRRFLAQNLTGTTRM